MVEDASGKPGLRRISVVSVSTDGSGALTLAGVSMDGLGNATLEQFRIGDGEIERSTHSVKQLEQPGGSSANLGPDVRPRLARSVVFRPRPGALSNSVMRLNRPGSTSPGTSTKA